jgi:hypothetical protein
MNVFHNAVVIGVAKGTAFAILTHQILQQERRFRSGGFFWCVIFCNRTGLLEQAKRRVTYAIPIRIAAELRDLERLPVQLAQVERERRTA